jgi:hypothetical protein
VRRVSRAGLVGRPRANMTPYQPAEGQTFGGLV